MELWFTEKQTPALGITCKVRSTLHREQTPYQDLAVLDTEQFGRMLVLDGTVQTTEADEFVYHEMIAHVPLFTHPGPERVAVIGGGDGGSIREILRHPTIKVAELIEIDRRVVEVCQQYLPGLSGSLADPRVQINITDGINHIAASEGVYDVVIVDSTDPVGPAVGLFAEEFYRSVHRALKPDGLLVAQTESPFVNQSIVSTSFARIARVFPICRLYMAEIPTYPSGTWTFTMGSKVHDPLAVTAERVGGFLGKYYNLDAHRRSFLLPTFVRELTELGEK